MTALLSTAKRVLGIAPPTELTQYQKKNDTALVPTTPIENVKQTALVVADPGTVSCLNNTSRSISVLKWASMVGELTSVVIMIVGLATHVVAFTIIGGAVAGSSAIAFLYASRKDIDGHNAELAHLNSALEQKNLEVRQLNLEINKIVQEFAQLQAKYGQLIADTATSQTALNNQLATAEDKLKDTLEAFKQQEKKYKNEIDADSAQIRRLSNIAERANNETTRLQAEVAGLQQSIANYKEQHIEHVRHNERLQKEIHSLNVANTVYKIDIESVTARAKALENLIRQQNAKAERVHKAADQLNRGVVTKYNKPPVKK